jgi:hypothetical protein
MEEGHLDLLPFSTCRGQQSTKISQRRMPDYPFARSGCVGYSLGFKLPKEHLVGKQAVLEHYLPMSRKPPMIRTVTSRELTGGVEEDNMTKTDDCGMEVPKKWGRSIE